MIHFPEESAEVHRKMGRLHDQQKKTEYNYGMGCMNRETASKKVF